MNTRNIPHPTDASIILTYRCPMKCKMCNIWFNPTKKEEEIKASDLRTLPRLKFINLTGGEPFVRDDLAEIVEECYKHTDRIVISTSGWFEEKVIALAEKYPQIGIRISIEGLSCKNDELRGHAGGFDKGLRTLLALKQMGLKDIGFGCTVQQLQGHAFAVSVEQIAGDGVRNGSVPQLLLFPQGRQRHYQQRRSMQELRAIDRVAAAGEPPQELVPGLVQHGVDQLHRRRPAYVAVRGRIRQFLHRPLRRRLSLQWTGREILAKIDGQHPPNARFHGDMAKRPGGGGACHGAQMSEELLDGGHSQSGHA